MAKRNRGGKHPKRKGPGGPVRPISSAPSHRVSGGGHRAPTPPPTDPLIDAVLGGFDVDRSMDPLQQVLHFELVAGDLLQTLTADDGPHLAPMLEAVATGLARRGTPETDRVLAALCQAARGPAAGTADAAPIVRAWTARRPSSTDPIAQAIGEDRPQRAIEIGHVMGDGVNVVLDLRNPLGRYTAAVYIDHNLGGMAKDLLLGPDLDEVRATFVPEEGFVHREIPLGEAMWRFAEALDVTSQTMDAPISDDFADLLPAVT